MRDIYTYQDNFAKYKRIESECLIKSKLTNPLITVFIPTYKRTDTLEETLSSVLNQVTDVIYEVIIVSNDPQTGYGATYNLLKKIQDNRISYYVNRQNIGTHGNFNRGVELANTEYVAMIHDDDLLSPYFLDSVIHAISKFNKPEIVGVGFSSFHTGDHVEFRKPDSLKFQVLNKRKIFLGKSVNIAGLTIKKSFLQFVGGYSEDYPTNADSIVIYQGAIEGIVVNIENELAAYRQDQNISLQPGVMNEIFVETEFVRRNIAEKEWFARIWMSFFDKEYLYSYICGANTFWGKNLDYREVFSNLGFSETEPSKARLFIMKCFLKLFVRS